MEDNAVDNAEEPPAIEVTPAEGGGVSDSLPEKLFQLEQKERKASKRRPGSFWKKPPTFVYANNFGFGIHSYQPMIDYLDAKDDGLPVNKDDIHLPLMEERCMRKYASDKPFKWYQNNDIDKYIDKGEKIRTQIRQNDAVGVSNVLRRTHTNWSMTRKWVQLVKKSYVVDYRKLHKKASEFEDTNYRSPTPVKVVDYRELTPKPRYLDDLSSEFASVVRTLAQSRTEHEQVMASRQEKMKMLDNKFEDTIDHIYEQMKRINKRADTFSSSPMDPREIEPAEHELTLRNRIRRQEEIKNMMECVNDLTEMDSARNTLRSSLRSLDNEVLGLSHRVDGMRELQQTAEHLYNPDRDVELDMLKAQIAARRSQSRARSIAREIEEDEIEEFRSCRRPKQAILFPSRERVTTRPRESLMREEVISDVHARVLNKAGELGTRTSEQRRINSRARFVNVFKPRPDTADCELLVPPSRTELNIDFMAKSLATRGNCQRRYDIDTEVEAPRSSINTNAHKDYCELRARKPIEQHPSLSNRVRCAIIRARARNALLGY
ncbi:uncharacterized protein LOC121875527 [Homarus americanus]|uniref:Paramyosin, short form-like 2 n=1 Tax=Homarus americanus TaxID=6706 RepID=A0A8J5MRB4_HOMAM|nr:uncharacterized protein LOC121875527 [Homarus americanus]KAG7161060.1 Paramyosin, short form-like 2 [Homarus americanus]